MFTIHTEESAPALASIRERIGFIPNLAAVIAGSSAASGPYVSSTCIGSSTRVCHFEGRGRPGNGKLGQSGR